MEEEAEEEEMKGKEKEEDAILFVCHWFMWRVTSFKPSISTLTKNDEHFSMRMWTLLQFCTTKTRRPYPEDSQRQGDIRRAETWTTVAKSVIYIMWTQILPIFTDLDLIRWHCQPQWQDCFWHIHQREENGVSTIHHLNKSNVKNKTA